MISWLVTFGASLLGLLILLTIKAFKPEISIGSEERSIKPSLQKAVFNAKNNLSRYSKRTGEGLGKTMSFAYNRSASMVKRTRVSGLVSGKGSFNGSETNSSFLKDIKETRDKVREDFVDLEQEAEEKEG